MSDLPGAGAPGDDEEIDLGVLNEELEPEEPVDEALEPEEPEEPAEPPEPRPGRQERRDERSRGRARELEQQNADLARRLAQLEAQRNQPAAPDPQAAAREEAAFRQSLETMLPHEASLAVAERTERRFQQQLMVAEVRGFDRADTAEFNALRARDRAAERLAPQVEAALQAERAAGRYNFGRLDIYDYLRGRELRMKGPAVARQQRQAGAARVAAQTTRPGAARGDVARGTGGGRDQEAADLALLRGTRLDEL